MMESVEYRDIPEFAGYRIGSDGSVWSSHRRLGENGESTWRQLKPHKLRFVENRAQYALYADGRRWRATAAILVLTAFVGPRPHGMHACHNNGDCTDDRLENLRWDTPQANRDDMLVHGTRYRGSRHPNAKLTEAKVREIRRRLANGERQVPLAKEFGVAQGIVSLIKLGRAWSHVS